jgi:hypothetical protein
MSCIAVVLLASEWPIAPGGWQLRWAILGSALALQALTRSVSKSANDPKRTSAVFLYGSLNSMLDSMMS